MPNCFHGICSCNCQDYHSEFDLIILRETKLDLRIEDITHQNICWFVDRNLGEVGKPFEGVKGNGLYFLWWKEDYCDKHHLFHMTCKYVGKGDFAKRLYRHYKDKNFNDEMLIYCTYLPLENRVAKYVEQLILDIYSIPLNKSENKGTKKLCSYFSQNDVD